MGLQITALALVLGITFMHAIFGFFSGLINVFCSVSALAIAFGFFEKVNELVTANFALHPGYTEPITLAVLFIVSLVVLRTLADNYVRGNPKIPVAMDWAGSAVCGFINAQIFVGMLVLCVLMLPIGGRVMGFERYSRNTEGERDTLHSNLVHFERNDIWLQSDYFAVGIFDLLSSGSLRGTTTFQEVYPDFPEAVFFSTNTPQPESSPSAHREEKYGDGFEKGLRVDRVWVEPNKTIEARYRMETPSARNKSPDYTGVTFDPASGMKLLGMRLVLDRSSADRQRSQLLHLFRPTMIRLVGTARSEPQQYVPRMIVAPGDPKIGNAKRVVDYDNNFSLDGQGGARIDVWFEVDEDFQPAFVEYRRHARAAVSLPADDTAAPDAMAAAPTADSSTESQGSGLTFGRLISGHKSGDNDKLPFEMNARALRSGDARLEGDLFAAGRIYGARDRLAVREGETKVEKFKLPAGRRLMQVNYKPREARTVVGDVFNFVAQLNTYQAKDSNANPYRLAGYYAIVKRGNQEYIELFFNGPEDDPIDPGFRGMLDFKELDRKEIYDQEDSVIGLFFLVPPGAELRRVEAQGGQGVDIRLRARDQ